MRHLVTGGSGFLGNLIARRLLARGHEVRVLDIWEDESRPKEIEFINCDIRDRLGVARALRGIDVVHHNVALVPLTKSGNKFWDVNVVGSQIAAEEAVKANVKSFIHMSSSAIYGTPKELPITQQTLANPCEIYGRGKLAGEIAVRAICTKAQLPLIVIRPRTILGEGRLGIFHILFEWIKHGKNIYTIGRGNGLFQFVHAHDLMDAYMLILDQDKPGAYNVGTDRYGTLREALENLVRHAGAETQIKSLPSVLAINCLRALDVIGLSPLAPWHYLTFHKAFHFDMAPLTSLGWRAQYSNDEMLRESYNWFVSNSSSYSLEQRSAHRSPVQQKILKLIKMFS